MPRGIHDVERLEHVRGLLDELGHPAESATLALYSLHGFDPDVVRAAAKRRDLLLKTSPRCTATVRYWAVAPIDPRRQSIPGGVPHGGAFGPDVGP
jgi:hypothetical protein